MGKDLKGKDLGRGIRQRKDGRYELRKTEKGVSLSICKNTLQEVLGEYDKVNNSVSLGLNIRYSGKTLTDWHKEWLEVYKKPYLKESSYIVQRQKFERTFGKILGDTELSALSQMDVQKAVNTLLEEGKSAGAVIETFGILSQMIRTAVDNKIIASDVTLGVVLPKREPKTKIVSLTKKERLELLDAVEGSVYKNAILFMLATGVRIGELGALEISDIDFVKKQIKVHKTLMTSYYEGKKTVKFTTPKTPNAIRVIPFIDDVESILLAQIEQKKKHRADCGKTWREKDTDLLFTTTLGSPVTKYVLERELRNIANGINKIRLLNGDTEEIKIFPHKLRHTFISEMFERGVNPIVIQKVVGHSNLSCTVDIYLSISEEKMREEILAPKNIEGALNKNSYENLALLKLNGATR